MTFLLYFFKRVGRTVISYSPKSLIIALLMNLKELSNNLSKLVPTLSYYYDGVNNFDAPLWIMIIPFSYLYTLFWSNYFSALVFISLCDIHVILYNQHTDASVKERPQTLLVPSEEICMRILCNKHIKHHLLFQTDKL